MARFKTILTNAGSAALTLAMYRKDYVFPDFAVMGDGIFDGEQATITELVSPVDVDTRVMDREFIEAQGDDPAKLLVSLQTFNTNLTEVTPIREILLYANSEFDIDGNIVEPGIPFAYAWLDGDDTDNILPPPLNPATHDTIHFHELAIFVTNQEVASIEVSFSFNGFVTHRYLNEIMGNVGGVEMSDEDIPGVGVRTHHRITADAPNYRPFEWVDPDPGPTDPVEPPIDIEQEVA